ncbi:MAG TPA: aldehyde dehydrogenase family protein [Actinomycetota bacterium]|nr:aldehyde dehydrogenase family protein [Actinomycetota bacterium]
MSTSTSRPRRSRAPKPLRSFDPRTGEVVGTVPATAPTDVADAVAHARKVAPEWAAIAPEGRARILRGVRRRVYELLDDVVDTVSTECGKPRAEALAHDVVPAVMTLLYYERTAARTLRAERPGLLAGALVGVGTRVERRPYGVVGCITPWNYPFFLAVMAAAPALFAGNAVVLKPSEVTPGVGERLRAVLDVLPTGVATVVQGAGDVGAALVDAPCDKIAFIGSPATGRKIAAAAARHLTPVVLELGGLDAAIVCDDADLDVATSGLLWSSFFNAGQTCASIERVFVAEDVADEFTTRLLAKLRRLRQGAGDEDLGALTFGPQLDTVRRHVDDAVAKGARVLAGGPDAARDDGTLFYPPTVLAGVTTDMDVLREETFGPVLPIVRVRDEHEAVRRTNEEGFNLTASVWTTDPRRARAIASRIRAGTIAVNGHGETAGAPWAPWGGVGESGYGRLNGRDGLREMTYPVTVARNLLPAIKRPYWYPYDDDARALLRSAAAVLAAPGAADRARHASALLRNVARVVKSRL